MAERQKRQHDEAAENETWGHSLARFVGRAARWASDEVEEVQSVAKRAMQRGKPSTPKVPVRELLQKLGTLVSSHGPDTYEALRTNAEFWSLIDELHTRRALARRRRRARNATKAARAKARAKRGDNGAIVDAEVIDAEVVDAEVVSAEPTSSGAAKDDEGETKEEAEAAPAEDQAAEEASASTGEEKKAAASEKKARKRKSDEAGGDEGEAEGEAAGEAAAEAEGESAEETPAEEES